MKREAGLIGEQPIPLGWPIITDNFKISDSCMKNPLTDRRIEGGLVGAVDRAILGGLGMEVIVIRVFEWGRAILGGFVLDRGSAKGRTKEKAERKRFTAEIAKGVEEKLKTKEN